MNVFLALLTNLSRLSSLLVFATFIMSMLLLCEVLKAMGWNRRAAAHALASVKNQIET